MLPILGQLSVTTTYGQEHTFFELPSHFQIIRLLDRAKTDSLIRKGAYNRYIYKFDNDYPFDGEVDIQFYTPYIVVHCMLFINSVKTTTFFLPLMHLDTYYTTSLLLLSLVVLTT